MIKEILSMLFKKAEGAKADVEEHMLREDAAAEKDTPQKDDKLDKRVYVVFGEQVKKYTEPSYSTHPDFYDFPFDRESLLPVSPATLPPEINFENFDPNVQIEKGPIVIKVFTNANDAINFTYHCNMVSVVPRVYEFVNEKWISSSDQSVLDIDW